MVSGFEEYWSGLPFSTPGNLPNPGIKPTSLVSPALASGFFTPRTTWEAPAAAAAKSLQSCLTLSDPIDGSPPGSAVPGILQARTLEWVALSFSREFSQSRDLTCISYVSCIGKWILYH